MFTRVCTSCRNSSFFSLWCFVLFSFLFPLVDPNHTKVFSASGIWFCPSPGTLFPLLAYLDHTYILSIEFTVSWVSVKHFFYLHIFLFFCYSVSLCLIAHLCLWVLIIFCSFKSQVWFTKPQIHVFKDYNLELNIYIYIQIYIHANIQRLLMSTKFCSLHHQF